MVSGVGWGMGQPISVKKLLVLNSSTSCLVSSGRKRWLRAAYRKKLALNVAREDILISAEYRLWVPDHRFQKNYPASLFLHYTFFQHYLKWFTVTRRVSTHSIAH